MYTHENMWRNNSCIRFKEARMVRTIHFMAHSNNDLSFNKQRPHSDLSTGKLSFNLRPKERMTENP